MRQRIPIENSAMLGKRLQESDPTKIRDLSLRGYSAGQIAQMIDFDNLNNLTLATKRRAIIYSRSGYKGSVNVPRYCGLLSLEENMALAKLQKEKSRKSRSHIGVIIQGKKLWIRKENLPRGDPRPGELESLAKLLQDYNFPKEEVKYGSKKLMYQTLAEQLGREYPEVGARSSKAIRVAIYKCNLGV